MPISPKAQLIAREAVSAGTLALAATYAERIRQVQAATVPPLSNSELSLGLDLGEREVGRFVSTKGYLARARPDRRIRAVLDGVLAGELLLAVQAAVVPGARREVLICDESEARRLDRTWKVHDLSGESAVLQDWQLDDDDVWDMGGTVAKPRPAASVTPRRVGEWEVFPIGFGAMRLSTEGRPEDRLAVLQAALDAGVTLIDTADSYALDEGDVGHNERLIARVKTPALRVATKAGLRRPGGKWVPDARPEHLRARCEQSLENLGVDALDLLQLHVVDPEVPLADSVGELARLREEGKVRHVGLCNVKQAQVEEALGIVPIAAVQNHLSVQRPGDLALAAWCHARDIAYLAHSPLGGHARVGRLGADGALDRVAAKHGASVHRVALAWLLSLGPRIVPLVGARRLESLRDSTRLLQLDDDDLARLDRGRADAGEVRSQTWRAGPPEIVLIMGCPASGKTSRVRGFTERGYVRLNRDEVGGKLDDLLPLLERGLDAGERHFVLDNTYPSSQSRAGVLQLGQRHDVPVRCVHIDIPEGEALFNASKRMLARQGRLLDPDEITRASKLDPNLFPPMAIYAFQRNYEAPSQAEGFAEVETVPFVRRPEGTRRALILDYDGTLRDSLGGAPFPRTPDEVALRPGVKATLQRYAAEGWKLLGVSNQAGIARGDLTREQAEACFARTNELLGLDIDVRYCPHPSGAVRCWCRKPMPGLGVALIQEHGLRREDCVMVGDRDSDVDFARNLGVQYRTEAAFFGEAAAAAATVVVESEPDPIPEPRTLRFAVSVFDRVFDTEPKALSLTLEQLTSGLTRFELKTRLQQRIQREVLRVERAYEAHRAGEAMAGKVARALRDADDPDAERAKQLEKARGAAKTDLALWSPNLYRPGAKRGSDGVIHLSCLALDHDEGMGLEEAQQVWRDFHFLLHTTWSHHPDQPRFRVVLPLAGPVPAEDWARFWAWADARTDGRLDKALKGRASTFALPATAGPTAARVAVVHEAPLLDPLGLGLVDAYADPAPQAGPLPAKGTAFHGGRAGHGYVDAAAGAGASADPDWDVEGAFDLG